MADEGEAVRESLQRLTGKAQEDVIKHCNDLFERARKARLQFETQWYMNIAFYFGKQNVQWAPGALGQWSRLWEPPAPSWRVRLIANRVRPLIRTELAKVTKEKPTGFVIPATTDDDDLAAARAAEQIWEHLWRDLGMNKHIRRAVFWKLLCGTAFIKDWYDPSITDSSDVKGAIQVEPVTPFHLLVPDIQEEELENQPYLIHYYAKEPDWVKSRYKKDVKPDSSTQSTILEQKFLNALGIQNQPKEHILVKEAWIKPCKKYPQGTVVTWAGDTLLVEPTNGWPYTHKQYPFTKLDHLPSGRFYADSVIPDLIPLQKEYNRTRSQVVEAKNRMSKPQLLAQRGSINPKAVTSEPGLIIFYTAGYQPPTPLPLQNLPPYVIEELDRCLRDMDDISGQHEITKGRTPPGVTAATAISFLQEEDDSKLASTISSLEEGVERLGRHFLSHVNQFWAAERKVRVLGENGQYEAFVFSKANIKGNTDFNVQAGSAQPRSKAAKQAFIMELAKMQMIPYDRALKYLDMAETGRMYEEMQIDSRQAQRENLRIAAGEQILVNTWDAHEIHIEEHNNYRKRQAYEKLDEQKKAGFEQHVQMHQAGQMQAQMMQMFGQMGGAPGGLPEPPGNGQATGAPPMMPPGGMPVEGMQ